MLAGLIFLVLTLMVINALFIKSMVFQRDTIRALRENNNQLTKACDDCIEIAKESLAEAKRWRNEFLMVLDAADDDPNLQTVRVLLPEEIEQIQHHLSQITGVHSECAITSLSLIKTLKDKANAIRTLQEKIDAEAVRTAESFKR